MMFLTSALTNALRSETTKLLSLRSTLVYTILMAGSLFGTATLIVLFSSGDPVTMDWAKLGYGYQIFQLIAVVFAATTAGDIRNHLHAQAFLTQRGRWQWVGAKIIVTMVFVAASYLVGTALSLGISAALGAELILGAGETAFYVPLIGSMVFAAVSVGLASDCCDNFEIGECPRVPGLIRVTIVLGRPAGPGVVHCGLLRDHPGLARGGLWRGTLAEQAL